VDLHISLKIVCIRSPLLLYPLTSLVTNNIRKDTNPARMKAFQDSVADSEKYFTKYGDNIRLYTLGTHPDYWRQGFGTTLCQWGMEMAADQGLVVLLVASIMGRNLYTKLNFTTLGEVVKQVPGEKERVISHAMVFDPTS
jgi:ribosomal protein S18 acetylase RimI-like enzyme